MPRLVRTLTRIVLALGLAVAGAVTAVAVVAVHPHWWGLALGLGAGVAVVLALPARWWCRPCYAGGWAAMVGYLSVPRPEGDYAVASDLPGYALLVGTFALVLLSLLTLRPTPR